MAIKVCLLACLAWIGMETILASTSVKVGILVPDMIFMRRSYKGTAFRAINSAKRDLDNPDYDLQMGMSFVDDSDSLGEAFCSMVDDQGASAMLVAVSGEGREHMNEEKIEQMANRLQVPTLIWNQDGYTPAHGPKTPVLYLMPTQRQQLAAMLDFMQNYGWKDYVILSEYPASSFRDINVSVVEFGADTVEQGVDQVKKVLRTSPYKTKVVLLFAHRPLAQQVFEVADSDMLNSDYVWLLSSAAVESSGNYPVGVFGFDYLEEDSYGPVKEIIQEGISAWYGGVKEAVSAAPEVLDNDVTANCEDGTASATGYDFFKLISSNGPDGFNHLGEPLGIELSVFNLKSPKEWNKMGIWTPQSGLELNLPVFLGGQTKPPAAHV